MQPGGDDGELLLHAVGIGGDGLGQIVRQLEAGRVVADAGLAVVRADAEDVGDEIEVFDAGHEFVEIGVIRDVGHQALAGERVFADGCAADADIARVELQDAGDGFEGGGLARAVVADEAVNFTGSDVQAEVVNGLLLAVGFGQMFDSQHNAASLHVISEKQTFDFMVPF